MSSESAALLHGKTFWLDSFALRQWDDPNYGGSRMTCDKQELLSRAEAFVNEGGKLVDGYAPFCRHIFIPNFSDACVGSILITEGNVKKLKSGYTKRRPEELAVLTRWFVSSDVEVPVAKWLDIILYSRDQLVKEYNAMPQGKGDSSSLPNVPWGIISIKAQDEPFETPMQPITMLRNSLGKEEGGSGVPIDREAYSASVKYWEAHAMIVDGEKPNGE
jgi:hypothetical protein